MKSAAIIGYTGKGLFNTPTKIESVKDLHINFGKKSNLTTVAEQLLFGDYIPVIVRVEENVPTASACLADDDGMICMTIDADSPGASGNSTIVEVTREADMFSLLVMNNGEMVEFWGNLKPNEAEDIINLASKWIVVSVKTSTLPASGKIELKSYHATNSYKRTTKRTTNLNAILNAIKSMENNDIEFISLPDCDTAGVINGVLQYLEEERPDVILAVDPPWECDLLQTYKWCKELIPSDQGFVFWPWMNYEKKSVPPSGPVLTAILGWPFVWKPVRTKLAGVSDAVFSIHHDELVYLSKQEHVINLATQKNDSLILDSKILTLSGSKLADRRLIGYVKSEISKLGRELLSAYNPVSNNFRNNFIECGEYILQPIKDDQGINNYVIHINEFCKPEEFEVDIELAIRDSTEIVNICFKFTK